MPRWKIDEPRAGSTRITGHYRAMFGNEDQGAVDEEIVSMTGVYKVLHRCSK